MTDKVKVEDERTIEIAVQEFRRPVVDSAVILEVSAKGVPRPRYRAGYTLPVCEHKHRSIQAAGHCAIRFAIEVAEKLNKNEEVTLADPNR